MEILMVDRKFEGKKGYPCFQVDQGSEDRCMNSSKKGRDHPPLTNQSLELLREMFRPDINKFNKETGRNIRVM